MPVTVRLDRVLKVAVDLASLPSSTLDFYSFSFASGFVGSCVLHAAGDDRKASTASHAGPWVV